jgi:hypothetical protein
MMLSQRIVVKNKNAKPIKNGLRLVQFISKIFQLEERKVRASVRLGVGEAPWHAIWRVIWPGRGVLQFVELGLGDRNTVRYPFPSGASAGLKWVSWDVCFWVRIAIGPSGVRSMRVSGALQP